MPNLTSLLRMAFMAAILTTICLIPATASAGDQPVPACTNSQALLTLQDKNKHCRTVAPVSEVTNIVSNAPCSLTITGTNLSGFDYITIELTALVLTPTGYTNAVFVYKPNDPRNFETTTVTVNETSGQTTVTITDTALCGQTLNSASVVFPAAPDGTILGIGFYTQVQIQA